MRNDIYNGIRATLLLTCIALATISCAEEKNTIQTPDTTASIVETAETKAPTTERISNPTITHTFSTTPPPETEPSEAEPIIPETSATHERYELTAKERLIVEAVVAAESRGEDFDGQCLVAQCILNTAEAQGKRPDEVVLAPKQYAAPAYDRASEVSEAVAAVFDEGYRVTEEPIRFFYSPKYGTSKWHESLTFVIEHGNHRFFKEN